ncbi:MAG TPA: carbamoyl-phosphate synthase large subunit [Clostridiaceae bacterium]|nr:carbamoyl-phosphate synthase large subunit [Clostridiaceae bacterium]
MPKRTDIKKIMIIGSGPIIIGQACEFDYSGTQACKTLKKLGYEVVLVNSNPATIMTDPGMADVTYIEPLNINRVSEIIAKERPDALLPNLGGQSALNLCSELAKAGILDKYQVKVIGVQIDAIERGEDRIAFKETMNRIGVSTLRSESAYSVEEAERIAMELGFPVVVRPAYTLGGTGGGHAYNIHELRTITERGISASMVGQVLIEESVIGWEELEVEVIRDSKNNMIVVCFIENVDPMGVHTGDSFCVAPMLTVNKEIQDRLQKYSFAIMEGIQVIGGANVQFCYNPKTGRIAVVEVNPRTSRSSALASKATGLPIAVISTMLAVGINLDEIPYWKEGTLDKYTPSGEYVIAKFPRWNFEKLKNAQDKLGTQMKSVGEVMAIGKNFKEAFQKAIRSLENGRYGLGFVKNFNSMPLEELLELLKEPSSERYFIIYEALRKGASIEEIHNLTKVKHWYIEQMKELINLEEEILKFKGSNIPDQLLITAKKDGFSDKYLAKLLNVSEAQIRDRRIKLGVCGTWDFIPVSGVENSVYYYSTYNGTNAKYSGGISDTENINDSADSRSCSNTTESSEKPKVMILGGGPNRIGQGIEFDYCCVHAAFALKDMGISTIMVNCNPETVSTDYDTSDKLYFEPLTVEDVLKIYNKEKPLGVIVQFGGQTPLNIAKELAEAGVKILGTSPEIIDLAEDRDQFRKLMDRLNIPMPKSGMASNLKEALAVAENIGYPLMVRPSYVLGGRGMEVVYDENMLRQYVEAAVDITPERPILIDKFLEDATEAEADAFANGEDAFVPAIMEHIELAGIHSGDSACVIPTVSIPEKHLNTMRQYTKTIAQELKVVGLINIQYAIANDKVYVLEANPRASRTVPLVSKVCGISMARIATQLMALVALGQHPSMDKYKQVKINHYGVKEAVFPFNMFPEVDPVLGPEMRSTGEVLGLSDSFGLAFFKSQEATSTSLPDSGTLLISVAEPDKAAALEVAREFAELGFKIKATRGTYDYLAKHGIKAELINKLYEGRPNIIDAIVNREIQLIINTPIGKQSQFDDSYIRKTAIKQKVPYITTIAAAHASAKGIGAYIKNKSSEGEVKSLQEYHRSIEEI